MRNVWRYLHSVVAWKKTLSFFLFLFFLEKHGTEIFCTVTKLWECKERKPCGYLPKIITLFGLHLSCGLRDS